MAERPKRPCRKAGCRALVVSGYCDAHKTQRARTYEKWRGSPADRGYDCDWDRVRIRILKRDAYLCQSCLKRGLVTPAKDVDHIVPLRVAPERRLDETNLQSLCRACHNVKTASEQAMA